MYNVWFVGDLHLGHKNILKYQKNRLEWLGLQDENDIITHDKKILDLWLNTIKRGDHVYILGDFIMGENKNHYTWKLLSHLKSNGCKIHLIIGNHDKQVLPFTQMFESMDLIKEVTFKKNVFPFLDEDFSVVMCHYPMISWNRKAYGTPHLHGHTHDNSPWENENNELRLNVGFDTPFSHCNFISLEQVYSWYKTKLNGLKPREYIDRETKNNPIFIR